MNDEGYIVDNEQPVLLWTNQLPFANCYSYKLTEGCALARLERTQAVDSNDSI